MSKKFNYEEEENRIDAEISKIEKSIKFFKGFAWILIILGFAIALFGLVSFWACNKEVGFALNLLGDFLAGSVASVWGLAGLFLIYISFLGQKQQILHQQKEILLSRLEIQLNREELKGQKVEMETQNATLARQRFEASFFQMYNNLRKIMNNIGPVQPVHAGDKPMYGQLAFWYIYSNFKLRYTTLPTNTNLGTVKLDYQQIIWGSYEAHIGFFFNNFFQCVNYVDAFKELNPKDKFEYLRILKATIPQALLMLLFYHGLSIHEGDYKKKIEKYSLLEYLNKDFLIDKSHWSEYSHKAID